MAILPRQYYGYDGCGYDRYNNYTCYNNGWYNWGRWVLLAIILIGALLIFFLFACITARRRRRMGYRPYRGTAWALGRNQHNAQPQYQQPYYQQPAQSQPYYANNNNANNAPPAYQPSNAGYYGNTDPNVQQPQNAYKPPEGPPPNRV